MDLGPTSYVVLGMLAKGSRSGYDIKQLADISTRHFWAVSYGQIYPELKRLAAAGLVKSEDASRGTRQRTVYNLTAKGRQVFSAWVADPTVKKLELRDEMLLKLAEIYDREVRRSIDRMLALLVPGVTIALGLVVAVVMGSIMSAIFSVYDLAM